MGKKDVHKLSVDKGHSFVLYGISSHENDYRLSWAFNEYLGFRFTKTENHKSFDPRLNEYQEFSTYSFYDDEYSHSYKLISNRCDNGFLLDELKNIDFLLILEQNTTSSLPAIEIISKIKTIPFVSAVFPINLTSLKNLKKIL